MCAVLVHGQRQHVFSTDVRVQSLALCRALDCCLRTRLPHRFAIAGAPAALGGRCPEVSDGGSLFESGSVCSLCMVL